MVKCLCAVLLEECSNNTVCMCVSFPQLTVMNAGRKYLKTNDLTGKVFLTSGLGGMSGAQAKAAVIAGCIGVIAEVEDTISLAVAQCVA